MSVSTVENREEGWLPFPDFSAYVTVKLDPVKSVEHLKDEEAIAAASTALSNTYVGYISGEGRWIDDDDEEHAPYEVQLLRSDLPRPVLGKFIDKNMCIPVYPNTQHPSRKPLVPNKPFPSNWSNCYHASFETATLRAPVAYAKRDIAVNLPIDERIKHITAIMADKKRINQLSNDHHPMPMVGYSEQHVLSPPSGNDVDAPTSSRQSTSSRARSVSLASMDENDEASKPIPPPISTMSYNLAAVSAVADPQGLLEEMKFIERLIEEARGREPARRAHAKQETARAIEEAKKLDDATYGTAQPDPTATAVSLTAGTLSAPGLSSSTLPNLVRANLSQGAVENPPAVLEALGQWAARLCCCGGHSSEENVNEAEEKRGPFGVSIEPPRY